MTEVIQNTDVIDWNEKEGKLPSMLNVLTILTFIGSGIGVISAIWAQVKAKANFETMQETVDKLKDGPAFAKAFLGPDPLELARRGYDNRIPVFILGLAGIGLCIYGAIEMRKLKKQGFWIYIIGEILPLVTMAIFIGLNLYSTWTLIWTFAFLILFIALYTSQLKYLK